ncbi:Uncharacterized protein HZ326_24959 [Fusarium oxysporum f. sp. albedinis]|nr:Uncharacterized protein HZ326_24959 [Fusarium oxysporum f. sp. albedinis]
MVAYQCYEATSALNSCGATRRDSLSEWVLNQIHSYRAYPELLVGMPTGPGARNPTRETVVVSTKLDKVQSSPIGIQFGISS